MSGGSSRSSAYPYCYNNLNNNINNMTLSGYNNGNGYSTMTSRYYYQQQQQQQRRLPPPSSSLQQQVQLQVPPPPQSSSSSSSSLKYQWNQQQHPVGYQYHHSQNHRHHHVGYNMNNNPTATAGTTNATLLKNGEADNTTTNKKIAINHTIRTLQQQQQQSPSKYTTATATATTSNIDNTDIINSNNINNSRRANKNNSSFNKNTAQQILPQLIDCSSSSSSSSEVQEQLRIVIMNLQRSTNTKPWGIAFSKFSSDSIVIGHSSTTKLKESMKWCYVVKGGGGNAGKNEENNNNHNNIVDARKIFINNNEFTTIQQQDYYYNYYYANSLKEYAKSITTSSSRNHHNQLRQHDDDLDERLLYPGDLIVALDGRRPNSFSTLTDIMHYFQSRNQITLVVLRHTHITTSALSVWKNNTNNSNLPGEASDLAFKMWIKILGPKAMGVTSTSTTSSDSSPIKCANRGYNDDDLKRRQQIQLLIQQRRQQQQQQQQQAVSQTCNNDVAALDVLVQIALMQRTASASASATTTMGKCTTASSYHPLMMTTMMQPSADYAAGGGLNIVSPTQTPFVHRLPQNEIVTLIKHPQEQKQLSISSSYKKTPPALPTSSAVSSSQIVATTTKKSSTLLSPNFYVPETWHNPLFRNKDGQPIQYEDNWNFEPEDGYRAKFFMKPIHTGNFQIWMKERKKTWRSRYKVYRITSSRTGEGLDSVRNSNNDDEWEYEERTVAAEFWKHRNIDSFDDWLSQSLPKWKHSYSWNRRKRKRIQMECEEVVHISNVSTETEFMHWLHVRKNQWRLGLLRRKRQRQRLEAEKKDSEDPPPMPLEDHPYQKIPGHSTTGSQMTKTDCSSLFSSPSPRKRPNLMSPTSNEMAFFDDILEEEDRHRKVLEDRHPIDISFLFDSSLGAPDDVVVHCLKFLERSEHGKLLCISKTTSSLLARRENVWRQLCPSHWILPRRPRKPWHRLYITKLRDEHLAKQKRWDDLMLKLSSILLKGDHLQKIQKLLAKGEKEFGFTVNYVSPVVCERNSVLNLSVINQRHKIVRWLVDDKGADIETYDRGRFTPLLNAAWAGDRQLVRFFLQRGSDRTVVGTGHYSEGLAPADFNGLTAEQWARKRGHMEIAELIRLGL